MVKTTQLIFLFFYFFILNVFAQATSPIIHTFKTRDEKSLRYAHWKSTTSPVKGKIILLEGMGEYLERFQETAEELTKRGYDVWCLDWRGQGRSQRETQTKTLLHVDHFDDYLTDLDDFLTHISPHESVFILANSMGGNIAMRYAHIKPEKIKSMVLVAPMLKIRLPMPKILAKTITTATQLACQSDRFVLTYGPFDFEGCEKRFNKKKHGDKEIYKTECQFYRDNQDIAIGGPSFSWLHTALDSCDIIEENVKQTPTSVPLLIISVKDDHMVDETVYKPICDQLKHCKLALYEEASHGVLRDVKAIRQQFWNDFDRFMETLENQ